MQGLPNELPTMTVVPTADINSIGKDAHLLLKVNGTTVINGQTYLTVAVATASDAAFTAARFLLLGPAKANELTKVALIPRNGLIWANATGVIAVNSACYTAAGGQVASSGSNAIGINAEGATVANGRFLMLTTG